MLAGLGCIGKNNMVVTPAYGPRIRWRALLLDRSADAAGPLDFDPCDGCPQPCRKACPVKAFDHTVYSSSELGQSILPGVDGTYDRLLCNARMSRDVEEAAGALAANAADGADLASTMSAFEEMVTALPKADGGPRVRCQVLPDVRAELPGGQAV